MNFETVKVFIKINNQIYRRILKIEDIAKNDIGQLILPPNHYSKGYIERIIDGIEWEDYPYYREK